MKKERGIVVAALTKDIEHLLSGRARWQKLLEVQQEKELADKKFLLNLVGLSNYRDQDLIFGKSGRVYSRQRLYNFVGRKSHEVVVKVSSFRKTTEDLQNHLRYITRSGKVELRDQNGNVISSVEERKAVIDEWHDFEMMKTKARLKFLGREMREGEYPTVAMSIIFSMSSGTDRILFASAMTEYAQEYFADRGFDYLIAFHNDTKHPHCHMLLRNRNMQTLRKWYPGKKDLRDMREAMAEKMGQYGLSATSVSSRLRGKLASENRKVTHKDFRDMREAMLSAGMKEDDINALLASKYKSGLQEEMNTRKILSNRQRHLSASVNRALANPRVLRAIEGFYQACLEERGMLVEAIGNVAKDIVSVYPEEAGMLVKYANDLPDPKPEVLRIIETLQKKIEKNAAR